VAFVSVVDTTSPVDEISELRLQCNRVYTVGVKAFANALCLKHEMGQRWVSHDDVCGSYGFVLVQRPRMQLVYGSHPRNLTLIS